jgi:hypothetical protein
MAAGAKAIADSAQAELDLALPALDSALASLKSLTRNDIVEVKSLRNPPQGVKMVMEATCIMFNLAPKMIADPNKVAFNFHPHFPCGPNTTLYSLKWEFSSELRVNKEIF